MIWKCLIVDDEPPALKIIKNYIDMVENLSIVASCSNAFQAMEILKKEKVDLLFLDIQMPKLTGIGFIKTLAQPPKVIFTTAYKEYAVDAFDLDAVDYLLKPVSLERFLKAVNKVTNSNKVNEGIISPSRQGFLYFRSDRKMVKVFLDEIIFIESLKDYIRINRVSDQPLMVKQSISTIEAMLPPDLFLRIHRSFIISINKITAFTPHDVEIGNIEIPIGRQYQANMKKLC
ncbi:MAG: LytTR family DNA-binding domain-containing protein [Ginsengibacter sp.]